MMIATAARMREIDRLADAEFGLSTQALVERAGAAVFDACQPFLSASSRVLVLCGTGNNGADGLVAARLLHLAGHQVDLWMASDESGVKEIGRDLIATCAAAGLPASYLSSGAPSGEYALIVDALLGTGFTGAPRGLVERAIELIGTISAPVVSADIPSGICADSGHASGTYVQATKTVTFGLPKPFLFQSVGQSASGSWLVADLGFPADLLNESTGMVMPGTTDIARVMPVRPNSAHKGSAGKVLIVAGSANMPGAATLCATAAMRAGAGLVTLAAAPDVCRIVSHHLPEAIFLPLLGDVTHDAAAICAAQAGHQSAIFGPGLGRGDEIGELLNACWREWSLPTVVDADALTWVSRGVEPPKRSVFTPHHGEMARLMGMKVEQVQDSRLDVAKACAAKFDAAVLLKGPNSAVANSSGKLFVNPTGNPGMASAGMGDVLSGVIGAMLAGGCTPLDAAVIGAFWHGMAGDMCADKFGPVGYLASDLASTLPAARAKISSSCKS